MENVIALAVQDMHSSCSETSLRAGSRVRSVIPVVLIATDLGSTLPAAGFMTQDGTSTPQTYGTRKDFPSGYHTWSPPV